MTGSQEHLQSPTERNGPLTLHDTFQAYFRTHGKVAGDHYRHGAEAERARIVTFLRGHAIRRMGSKAGTVCYSVVGELADRIEGGEHV